jgi:hypothetical protein
MPLSPRPAPSAGALSGAPDRSTLREQENSFESAVTVFIHAAFIHAAFIHAAFVHAAFVHAAALRLRR